MRAAGVRRGPAGPAVLAGGAALLAGLAQAASIAWPWGGEPVWWLQLLSLGVFARLLVASRSARQGALLGWAFATAWLTGTFWWLFISMHTYGGLAAPLAALAVVGLAAFLGSYYAVASGCFRALAQSRRWQIAIIFGAFWLLAELARGQWWTGFPWGAGGYAHVEGPLAVLARSVGVYGIGFIAATLAMLVAQARRSDLRSLRAWVVLGLAVAAWVGLAAQRHCAVELCHTPMRRPAPLSIALLQGNIPQDEKFQAGSGVPTALRWYAEQLRSAQASLVVAPETAIPLLPQQLIPGYLDSITARYTQAPKTADGGAGGSGASAGAGAPKSQAALLGIPLGDMALGYTNSAMGFAPGQAQPYQYDKHHLVPFGEFIPPFFRWFTEMMNIPLGDFNRGAVGQAPFVWAGERIAPNICYEDLFGEELGARFTDPAQAPTIFVNLSNIGWFGDSVAIDQHLSISRMRSLEFERPMVRATNTGATAIIDHRGVVTQRLPSHVRGVLVGDVLGRSGDVTPYAWWVSRWGLWPLWAFGALVAGLAWLRSRRALKPRG